MKQTDNLPITCSFYVISAKNAEKGLVPKSDQ